MLMRESKNDRWKEWAGERCARGGMLQVPSALFEARVSRPDPTRKETGYGSPLEGRSPGNLNRTYFLIATIRTSDAGFRR